MTRSKPRFTNGADSGARSLFRGSAQGHAEALRRHLKKKASSEALIVKGENGISSRTWMFKIIVGILLRNPFGRHSPDEADEAVRVKAYIHQALRLVETWGAVPSWSPPIYSCIPDDD